MVVLIGNCDPSTRHSLPPSKTSNGSCESRLYLWVSGGVFQPCNGAGAGTGGVFPLAK